MQNSQTTSENTPSGTQIPRPSSTTHGICAEMAGGRERADIAASVLRDNPAFGNWNNADWFLIIANTDYCPWLQSPPPEPGTLGGGPE